MDKNRNFCKKTNKFFQKWQIQFFLVLIPLITGLWGHINYYNSLITEKDNWPLRMPLYSTIKLFAFSFDAKDTKSVPYDGNQST